MFDNNFLKSKSLPELNHIAQGLNLKPSDDANLNETIYAILSFQSDHPTLVQDFINQNPTIMSQDLPQEINPENAPEKKTRKPRAKKEVTETTETEIPAQANDESPAAEPKKRGRKKKVIEEAVIAKIFGDTDFTEDTAPEPVTEAIEINTELVTEKPESSEPSSNEASEEQEKPRKRIALSRDTTQENLEGSQTAPRKKPLLVLPKNMTQERIEEIENQQKLKQDNAYESEQDFADDSPDEKPEAKPVMAKTQTNEPEDNTKTKTPQEAAPVKKAPSKPEPKKEFNFDKLITIEGVLEILPDNYGFLRSPDFSYISSPDDVFVSTAQIKSYALKTGDTVVAKVKLPKEGEKYFAMAEAVKVNGRSVDFIKDRVAFEYLTPLFPQEKFNLAGENSTLSTRIIDLFAPIGKGQRAMIVAQPKTGKTMLLKEIANSIAANHPEAYMIVLLIDERPEEVTDMQRSVNAEVIASTFDESAEKHVKVANLVLSKAQRMVECGHDVVILLDSITRLARAYNTVTPASGKILSGGVDANALHRPKRFFGAARKIEGGGSLTIIATALTDTGSKMDEVIFEEFKGTGNMELQLDRKIANRRVYPAIDLTASSTRRDDLLLSEMANQRMWLLRKFLADMNAVEAMEFVQKQMRLTRNNEEFLIAMNK